jgi:hypothetical protein
VFNKGAVWSLTDAVLSTLADSPLSVCYDGHAPGQMDHCLFLHGIKRHFRIMQVTQGNAASENDVHKVNWNAARVTEWIYSLSIHIVLSMQKTTNCEY